MHNQVKSRNWAKLKEAGSKEIVAVQYYLNRIRRDVQQETKEAAFLHLRKRLHALVYACISIILV